MLKNLRSFVQLILCTVYPICMVAMDHHTTSEPLKIFHCFENLPEELQEKVVCDIIVNTDSPNEVLKTVGILACTSKKFNHYMHDRFFKKHIDQTIEHNLMKIYRNKKRSISERDKQRNYRLLDTALEYDLLVWLKPQLNLDEDINVNYPALYKLAHIEGGYFKTESTLLHQAANYNAYKITKFLLNNFPTYIDQEDLVNYTPLQIACLSKSFEVAELLLDYGASPNPNNEHYNLTTNMLNHLNNKSLTIKEKEKTYRLLQAKQKINPSWLDRLQIIILKTEILKDYITRPSLFPLYLLAYMHYYLRDWSMME